MSGKIAESHRIMIARPYLLGEIVSGTRDLFRVLNLKIRDFGFGFFLLFRFIVTVTGSLASKVAGKLDWANELDENAVEKITYTR